MRPAVAGDAAEPGRKGTNPRLAVSFFFGLALLGLLFCCSEKAAEQSATPAPSVLGRLREVPGFEVAEVEPPLPGYSETFRITFSQRIDHQDPGRGTFKQVFYLSSRGQDLPVVFATSGYGVSEAHETELAGLLQCNQITMGHRFFTDDIPQDWTRLTIRQAADDQHAIRQALKDIYPGKWVGTGISKGGMTALFYRRFYPDDVTATVAYVAPIMPFPDDPRFAPFFEQVGTAECRQKLKEFQRLALSRRAQLMPLFRQFCQSRGYSFGIIPEAEAFEYTVIEYPFAFWQYGRESDCAGVPDSQATDQRLLDHLVGVSSPSFYADRDFLYYQPLFYQAYTEIGYSPYIYDHLIDLLQAVAAPTYRSFAPLGVDLIFRPEVMQDVIPWLQTQGQRIIYIYGGLDPWSAAALEPAPGLDALKVVQPGGNHNVRIQSLDQRSLVLQTLERWLGIRISSAGVQAQPAPPARTRL